MGTLWQGIQFAIRTLLRGANLTCAVILILAPETAVRASASKGTHAVLMSPLALVNASQMPSGNDSTLVTAGPTPEDGTRAGLIAWWKLDEADGNIAQDSSGNGFAGTLLGSPLWEPTGGKVKGALALDGIDDAVVIQNNAAFSITGAITVCAWIKVNSFDKRWQTIIAKGDTAWRLQRTAQEDTIAFHCTGLHSVKGRWPLGIEGRTNVNDGRWHHVAGVYDGAVISLYIDGVLDNSSRASGTIQVSGLPVSIGANAEASGRNWSGLIDDVCVFTCALNASGVSALYSGGDPGVIGQQASAVVSAEDVAAELRAGQMTDANVAAADKNAVSSGEGKSWKWPLVATVLVGFALATGAYVVRRRRNVS